MLGGVGGGGRRGWGYRYLSLMSLEVEGEGRCGRVVTSGLPDLLEAHGISCP